MATIYEKQLRSGTSYQVKWREGGKQKALNFDNPNDAETFKRLLDANGQSFKVAESAMVEAKKRAPTFDEVLEQHLAMLTRASVGTVAKYRQLQRDHITPKLGPMAITAIEEFPHLVQWIKWMQDKGASPKTIANVHGLISATFATAVKLKHRPDNPCKGVQLPRSDKTKETATFLSYEEYRLLLSHIAEHYKPFVEFLVASGMRFSEATALTISDFNLRGKVPSVRVEKAWKTDEHGKWYIGPPKTSKARRTVSLPAPVVETIEPLLEGKPSDHVFTTRLWANRGGNPIRSAHFHTSVWQPAIRAAQADGLGKKPRVHDLRHTSASWLVQGGVNIYTISRRLGHESITVTMDRYSHLMPDALMEAAEGMRLALEG